MPASCSRSLELVAVGYPLWVAFDLATSAPTRCCARRFPSGSRARLVWLGAVAMWLLPLWQAVAARRSGEQGRQGPRRARVPDHAQRSGPRRCCCAPRVWTGARGADRHVPVDLRRLAGSSASPRFTALAAVHAYIVSCIRAVWWAQILGEVRAPAVRGRLAAARSSTTATSAGSCSSR